MNKRTKLILENAKTYFEDKATSDIHLNSKQELCVNTVVCTTANNEADCDASIPIALFGTNHETTEDHSVIDEQSDCNNFSDFSDVDPNYIPVESSDGSDESVPLRQEVKILQKRKMSIKERKGRKRTRNKCEWIDAKAKREQNLGLEHKNRKGKVIPPRQMKNACKEECRNKCRAKISEENRKQVFEAFWKIGEHTRQWDYIARCVKSVDKKQVTNRNGESKRNFSRKYSIIIDKNEIPVCKTMFLNTHGISEQWVTTALNKIGRTGLLEEDKRGKHNVRPHKIKEEVINSVRQHIKLFPLVPSHYTRKRSTRMYLEEGLNISKMHRLYLEYMQLNNIPETATLRQYREVLNSEFNIAFFKPKKDQCNTCAIYAMANTEDRLKMQENYDRHLSNNKETARSLKDGDKEIAVNDKTVGAACFDLQKVLITPQSEVSTFYYKSKLATYNFTVYDMGNHEGYCYVWNEQIAKRGPNEIGSCLLHYLKNQKEKGIKKIVLYSDNCGGQNRNRFIFSMYSYVSKLLNLEVTHRFLEKGHTQNEGDSMHAVIENAKKRQSTVYTPDQWVMLIRMAKVTGKPYVVKEMSQNDFFSFGNTVKSENWNKDEGGEKIKISKVKEVHFSPELSQEMNFKYAYADNHKTINLKKNRRSNSKSNNGDDLPLLYSGLLSIDLKKLNGLLELCNANEIPKLYHNYYFSLKPKGNKNTTTANSKCTDEAEGENSDEYDLESNSSDSN